MAAARTYLTLCLKSVCLLVATMRYTVVNISMGPLSHIFFYQHVTPCSGFIPSNLTHFDHGHLLAVLIYKVWENLCKSGWRHQVQNLSPPKKRNELLTWHLHHFSAIQIWRESEFHQWLYVHPYPCHICQRQHVVISMMYYVNFNRIINIIIWLHK